MIYVSIRFIRLILARSTNFESSFDIQEVIKTKAMDKIFYIHFFSDIH